MDLSMMMPEDVKSAGYSKLAFSAAVVLGLLVYAYLNMRFMGMTEYFLLVVLLGYFTSVLAKCSLMAQKMMDDGE
jgi:hypothetical protein